MQFISECSDNFFFFFCRFFKQWTLPCFLFCNEQTCLFEFPGLAFILEHNLCFIYAMLLLMVDSLPPFTSLLFVSAFLSLFFCFFFFLVFFFVFFFPFPHTFPQSLTILPFSFPSPSHLPKTSLPITSSIQSVYHVAGER